MPEYGDARDDFAGGPEVDEAYLAKCLGLERWSHGLYNRHERMAARVITDALRPDDFGRVNPDLALKRATRWITEAYETGRSRGAQEERGRFRQRVRELFFMEVGR